MSDKFASEDLAGPVIWSQVVTASVVKTLYEIVTLGQIFYSDITLVTRTYVMLHIRC